MNYALELDSKYQIIKVKVTCLLNQEVRKNILLEVASQLSVSNFSRVIIDLTESTFNPAEPMVGAIDLTNYMRNIGIQPHVKFAFIYSDAETHRKYFENVAQIDGFNLRYFKNFNEATAWLE
ncbi:hypothetical protein ACFL0H_12780 [Thermodesulfobacteriota bacterium]